MITHAQEKARQAVQENRPLREALNPRTLTARERAVVLARGRGLFVKEIAAQLVVSESTVRVYLRRAKLKLFVRGIHRN